MMVTRQISWIKAAQRDFEEFPDDVQAGMMRALTIAADYAVKIGAAIWVIHVFQKKSKTGIKTPQMVVDLVRKRLERLKEALQWKRILN
ncbi:MAG: type II toxin-antitoxin system RelE/ParE family toxin [Nitrospirota bacterium]